jgi:sulfur-oxidizing protein SoxY
MHRRLFLKRFLSCFAILISGIGGVLKPLMAIADWNTNAFSAVTEEDAIAKFFPDQIVTPSEAIKIGAYRLVENGAVVPVKIETELPDIQSITILVEKNPNPLIASFNISPECPGFIATRIKMDQSSDIIAIVNSRGKLHSTRTFVEVLEGGCG